MIDDLEEMAKVRPACTLISSQLLMVSLRIAERADAVYELPQGRREGADDGA